MNINKIFKKSIVIEIIPYSVHSGQINMMIDHFLATKCHEKSNPVIRFYGWKPSCVSLGIHQKKEVINIQKVKEAGYQIVRRPTGGRAIFHENELTYSIIISKKIIHHKLLYQFMHTIIARALNELDYAVFLSNPYTRLPVLTNQATDSLCFTRSARTEIQYSGRKLVGSAQKIYKNALLQHGSILIDQMHKKILDFLILSLDQEKNLLDELNNTTISLREVKNKVISPRLISKTVIKQLEKVKNISLINASLNKHKIDLTLLKYPYNI